ncbi:regulatory protein, tetR family [Rhodococcus triatomae]|uniref:Regulatory protein, tetR family n=2 Tax=Rhodococcus triatomae TaxID=300028 RepID=A0A1G8SNV6_9NOCA|nr:GntR family transcriptional regulator [Rhodococcus triatomae]SDJ30871.1 regulatory protein, tetR family [Rhodococcus triatomae]
MATPSGSELPPYARVVADIRARITAGELEPGARAPSTREITREWGVAMATATKALAALRQEGLVEAVRGVGTVVRGVPGSAARHPREPKRRTTAVADGGHTGDTGLNRDVIVQAAIAVADAEGIDGLSMRRVSTELRVSAMALYRHVTGKEDLVTEMIDKIYRDAALPEPRPEGWREALELAMRWEWAIYRRHPWAIRLTPVSGPVLSPGLMANAEWMMSVIADQGHSSETALEVVTILSAYTSGMAVQAGQAVVEEGELGLGAEQWWKSRADEFARFAAGGDYPVMFAVTSPPDVETIFTLGMTHLLDGLTPLIAPDSGHGFANASRI